MFAQALARTIQVNAGGPAIVDDANVITWREFGDRIARVAGGLRAIRANPGDRIALLAVNSPNHVIFMYAILWSGCAIVPLNTRLSAREMAHIIEKSGAKLLASDKANHESAATLQTTFGNQLKSIKLDEEAVGDISLNSLLEANKLEAWQANFSDLSALYYTGGTTGSPKGVMISDGALTTQTQNLVADLKMTSEKVLLHAPPIFHLAGAGLAHACCFSGATQAFVPEIIPDQYIHEIAKVNATLVSLVPTMLTDMMELPGIEEAFRSVETIVYGSAPISETLLRKIIQRCPDAELTQIYGQTECAGPCLMLLPEWHVLAGPKSGKLNSAGRANMTTEVRIVDENDVEVERGVPGEIILRAPSVMLGYWQQPDLTETTLRNGWLHTGDVGIMDEDGFVQIVDRLKDMIVTGGENVFCGEVENIIAEHPEIKYCAVIGLPDEKWGERVHAVVGIAENSTLDFKTLQNYCRQFIAGYKCPKSADFTQEPLPLSAVGKVRKDILREKYKD